MFDRSSRVADIVLSHAATASVFDRRRIDYCCQGSRVLERACDDHGVDVDTVLGELRAAVETPAEDVDPRTASTSALISRIIAHQHRDLRATLALLTYGAANLARERPGLRLVRQVRLLLDELSDRVLAHMNEEETELFPALLQQPVPDHARTALGAMFDDHADITRLLRRLRETTSDYVAPLLDPDLTELFAGLAELDALITRHHHVENHVLLPRFR